MCGISQPHIHNVLKSIRALSPGSADRLMDALGVTLPELLWRSGSEDGSGVRVVPVLRNRIGPGIEADLTSWRGFMPFPRRLVEPLANPVAARLAPDLVLPRMLAANDVILLDQSPEVRANPRGESCWVVAGSLGLSVRYVKMGGTKLYLAGETTVREPHLWEAVSLHGRDMLDIVRARVVWIGREMNG